VSDVGKQRDHTVRHTGMANVYIYEHHKLIENVLQELFHTREGHALNICLCV